MINTTANATMSVFQILSEFSGKKERVFVFFKQIQLQHSAQLRFFTTFKFDKSMLSPIQIHFLLLKQIRAALDRFLFSNMRKDNYQRKKRKKTPVKPVFDIQTEYCGNNWWRRTKK